MADQPITTSIDSLVKYLREHGEIDTTALSRVLGVNEGTVVDWADILEKAGILKITYKVGKMYLSPTSSKVGLQTQVEKAIGDVKKEVVENELLNQQDILNDVRSKLEVYMRTVNNAEAIFKERSGGAKDTLEKITLLEGEANKYYNEINSKRENVTKTVETLDKEIKSLESDAEQIRQFNLDTSGAKGVLDDITNKITVFSSSIAQMNERFNKTVEEQRNQLRTIEASVRSEVEILKEMEAAEGKRIAEYDKTLSGYRRKADLQSQKARKMRSQLLDEAIKMRDEVLGIYSVASAQYNSFDQSIKSMKDSWGLLAVFNDKLEKIKEDIATLSKQLGEVEKELGEANSALKSPKAGEQNVRSLESKAKSLRSATSALGKGAEKVKKNIDDMTK